MTHDLTRDECTFYDALASVPTECRNDATLRGVMRKHGLTIVKTEKTPPAEPMTLDSFAKAIEANARRMMEEQNRLIAEAQKAKLDPDYCSAVMEAIVSRIEKEEL